MIELSVLPHTLISLGPIASLSWRSHLEYLVMQKSVSYPPYLIEMKPSKWINFTPISDFYRISISPKVIETIFHRPASCTDTYYSDATWDEHHGNSNHRQLDCVFSSLLSSITMKIPKFALLTFLWEKSADIYLKRARNAESVYMRYTLCFKFLWRYFLIFKWHSKCHYWRQATNNLNHMGASAESIFLHN